MNREIAYVDTSGFIHVMKDMSNCDGSLNLKMDIYFPDDAIGPFPLIIFNHGGGFLGGLDFDG